MHKNEQINLIWLIPLFISRQKSKTVFSTGELIDKTIFKFQEPSGQFHLLLITLANLDAFLFQSFDKKNIGKKYWLLSLNMCNWKMLTIMMNSWGTFFYWLTTDVSEHVSQARAQKSRNVACEQVPCLEKGWKKKTEPMPSLCSQFFHPFPKQRACLHASGNAAKFFCFLQRNVLPESKKARVRLRHGRKYWLPCIRFLNMCYASMQ